MSLSKEETDIILNRANIALARSQRLVASWLPAPPSDKPANTKSEEELQREEDEIFTAVPETLGLGAPLPTKAADGSWTRTERDSNDELRKKLLGKNYKKVMAAKNEARGASKTASKTPNESGNRASNNDDNDDDDEDEGRTASIGKRMKKKPNSFLKKESKPSAGGGSEELNDGEKNVTGGSDREDEGKRSIPQGGSVSRTGAGTKGRKKATSFLDEILAERSKKRRKK